MGVLDLFVLFLIEGWGGLGLSILLLFIFSGINAGLFRFLFIFMGVLDLFVLFLIEGWGGLGLSILLLFIFSGINAGLFRCFIAIKDNLLICLFTIKMSLPPNWVMLFLRTVIALFTLTC